MPEHRLVSRDTLYKCVNEQRASAKPLDFASSLELELNVETLYQFRINTIDKLSHRRPFSHCIVSTNDPRRKFYWGCKKIFLRSFANIGKSLSTAHSFCDQTPNVLIAFIQNFVKLNLIFLFCQIFSFSLFVYVKIDQQRVSPILRRHVVNPRTTLTNLTEKKSLTAKNVYIMLCS